MTEIKAQEYINQNFSDKNIKDINLPLNSFDDFKEIDEKLTGELTIQDYPNLEEISLSNHELTSLTITNCPNLKLINIRNNQLTKLEISENNQLKELIASQNQLETLNLTNCPQITRLIVCDNPLLTEIKGLNLSSIKDINITSTLINLATENEQLKEENKKLYENLNKLNEARIEKEWKLVEPIQTPKQAEEALLKHLEKEEKRLRNYFETGSDVVLETRLNSPERKRKAKEILTEIIAAQTHKNYEKLAEKWSGIFDYKELVKKWKNEEDYGLEYDWTGSLDKFIRLLEARNCNQVIVQKS